MPLEKQITISMDQLMDWISEGLPRGHRILNMPPVVRVVKGKATLSADGKQLTFLLRSDQFLDQEPIVPNVGERKGITPNALGVQGREDGDKGDGLTTGNFMKIL